MSFSPRAQEAYSARLNGLASPLRASDAYSARLIGLAVMEQQAMASAQRTQQADTARWEAMARYYAGQVIPVTH